MAQLNDVLPRIRGRLANWWDFGDQEYPCIIAIVPGTGAVDDTDDLTRFWTDEDLIIRRKMAEFEQAACYGLAVPCHYIDQGSSAMACALGCPMEFVDRETVWAVPCLSSVGEVLDVVLDFDGPVYSRIRRLTQRSTELSGGHHMVAPFALEGMTDIMAALLGIEPFLMALALDPAGVYQAMAHLKTLWLKAWADIQSVIQGGPNDGGIGWAGIWAPGSTFPLQEDVAYNISPDMFRDFCMPHIRDQVAVMDYPFFHLDGIGMIPHLDHLLDIAELKAIQWQPGAGKESLAQWHELIRKILAAGKSVQVYARAAEVAPLVEAVGAHGVLAIITDATEDNVGRLLKQFPQDGGQ